MQHQGSDATSASAECDMTPGSRAMTILRATIKAGRLELDVPPDWPDGTEVEIHPIEREVDGDSDIMSPAEIAKTL
jgi:hypothetical protein